jgi:hypothetical protein
LEPIEEHVQIAQKTVKYTPLEKLQDGLLAILAGAHGVVEINKRVRADRALQVAFGREGCAEQSVVQDTLDACTTENVVQMQAALDEIYRRHSQGYRHKYEQELQVLDIDTTGRPCGPKAALATKGYFAHRPNRRGRQEGYVLATRYEEIVVKQLFSGTTQLTTALQPLVEAAEQTLDLTPEKCQRTLLRLDAGGGSVADVNWMLGRNYQVHGKDYSGNRAATLADSVREWFDDPRNPGRQVGWVTAETNLYSRPLQRIAARCPKKNGQWAVAVILSTLSPEQVLVLTGQHLERSQDPQAVLFAYVYFYDLRGGGVETEIKEDKHGLGTAHRNKKRFEGQQMLGQLEVLAHNLLIWARTSLAPYAPKLAKLGLLRLVRDALQVSGLIVFGPAAAIQKIILNPRDPLAKELQLALAALLAQDNVVVSLGET